MLHFIYCLHHVVHQLRFRETLHRLHISSTDSTNVMWSKFSSYLCFCLCLHVLYVFCLPVWCMLALPTHSSWILSWLPSWCPTSPSQLKEAEEKMLKSKSRKELLNHLEEFEWFSIISFRIASSVW